VLDHATPRTVRFLLLALAAWLVVDVVLTLHHGPGSTPRGQRLVYDTALIVSAGITLARGGSMRLAAAGMAAWGLGDFFYTLAYWTADSVPVPSPADAGYLLFPVLVAAAFIAALHRGGRMPAPARRADGFTAALAVAAVGAAIVWDPVQAAASGAPLAVATNLAYVLLDLALLGVCVGALAARGWTMDRFWLICAAGVLSFWLADSLYLTHTAAGDYEMGSWFDEGWSLGMVLIAFAAWQPAPGKPSSDDRMRTVVMPLVFAGVALALMTVAGVAEVDPLAVGLAAVALLGTFARLIVTFREHARTLERTRRESVTDALTGLGNRRALARELERALGGQARPSVLVLADLDGFKRYNDTFGHPAGDALLTRLGARLTAVTDGRGSAYRMGGDEFCALLEIDPRHALDAAAQVREGLTERGNGFDVGCSVGLVILPEQAGTAAEALRIADRRLYAAKHDGRRSAEHQSKDVLLRALVERHPDLVDTSTDVAALAEAVGRVLGLTGADAVDVRHAAELHDVGKVAIPDAILRKPARLDDVEWAFIRQHTLIGERILTAAPALSRVAPLVRSSHERWDGLGYPDGLVGTKIPLGARIVAVADAYDAMVSERPYAPARTHAAAIEELRRCAGSQFDGEVVEAFCTELEARRRRARERAEAGAVVA
jgi:diguanylate cyclase (GGDEF)-like protein